MVNSYWDSLVLGRILDSADECRRASRQSLQRWLSLFEEIVVSHRGIMASGLLQGYPEEVGVPVGLVRCSFDYFTAAIDVGLSGQVPACFGLQRLCIESAVYAHSIMRRPELGDIWLMRNDTPENRKSFQREFQITDLIDALPDSDLLPHGDTKELYNLTIDWGGHPNRDAALASAMRWGSKERQSGGAEFLELEGLPLLLALKTTALTGYCMACLEEKMFSVALAPRTFPERVHALAVSSHGDPKTYGIAAGPQSEPRTR